MKLGSFITYSNEKEKKANISIIKVENKEVLNENKNFKNFASDEELNSSNVLEEYKSQKRKLRLI